MAKKTDQDTDKDLDQDLDTEVDDDSQDEADEDDELDEGDDQETDDEDEDGDSEEEDDSESFKKRFTQFKGDTPAKYAKNLEDAYAKSSTEAVRLSKENKELKPIVDRIQALIATNPELAKQLSTAAPAPQQQTKTDLDPDIAWAKGERQRQWTKELGEFKKDHPELDSDPSLVEELNNELALVAEVYQRRNGYGISMAEGLRRAWSSLGYDNVPDKKERIAAAAREGGSRSKSGATKQSAPKTKLTEKQIEVAMEMMQIDRNDAIKRLSAFTK